MLGQFADQGLQRLRIKESSGRGESSQRGAWTAEFVLDLVEAAGLLHGAQAGQEGIEEGEQDQGGIMIEAEASVTGVIALCAEVVEGLEQGFQALKVLEAAEVLGRDLRFAWPRHDDTCFGGLSKRQEKLPTEAAAAFMPNEEKRERKTERPSQQATQMPCRTVLGRKGV